MTTQFPLLEEIVDIEKKSKVSDAPVEKPPGWNVVILNDDTTPAEVVVEAIVDSTDLTPHQAIERMMTAHSGGWAVIKSYHSADVAEQVAHNIQVHAENNTKYDHYKEHLGHKGPWPLTTDIQEISK